MEQIKRKLWLAANDIRVVKWLMDASFVAHPDVKSRTGAMFTFRQGDVEETKVEYAEQHGSRIGRSLWRCHNDSMDPSVHGSTGYLISKNILCQDKKAQFY